MKKTLLILVFLFCGFLAARAKTIDTTYTTSTTEKDSIPPVNMSVGLDFGKAIGSTSATYNNSLGLSFKFDLPFNSKGLNFVVFASYNTFSLQSSPMLDTLQSGHYLAGGIGMKYYFNKIFYFEGDVGISYNINASYIGYQSGILYAPIIGASLPVGDKTSQLDMALRFEGRGNNDYNQIALRVAYRFPLRKSKGGQ